MKIISNTRSFLSLFWLYFSLCVAVFAASSDFDFVLHSNLPKDTQEKLIQVLERSQKTLEPRIYRLKLAAYRNYLAQPYPRSDSHALSMAMKSTNATEFLPDIESMLTASPVREDSKMAIEAIVSNAKQNHYLSYEQMLDAIEIFSRGKKRIFREVFPFGLVFADKSNRSVQQLNSEFSNFTAVVQVVQDHQMADLTDYDPQGYAGHDEDHAISLMTEKNKGKLPYSTEEENVLIKSKIEHELNLGKELDQIRLESGFKRQYGELSFFSRVHEPIHPELLVDLDPELFQGLFKLQLYYTEIPKEVILGNQKEFPLVLEWYRVGRNGNIKPSINWGSFLKELEKKSEKDLIRILSEISKATDNRKFAVADELKTKVQFLFSSHRSEKVRKAASPIMSKILEQENCLLNKLNIKLSDTQN